MKSFHCHKFFYSLKLGMVFVCQQRALWLSSRPCAWSSTWSPSARRLGGSPGTWWALTSGIRRSTACAKSSRFVLVTLGSYKCPNKAILWFHVKGYRKIGLVWPRIMASEETASGIMSILVGNYGGLLANDSTGMEDFCTSTFVGSLLSSLEKG